MTFRPKNITVNLFLGYNLAWNKKIKIPDQIEVIWYNLMIIYICLDIQIRSTQWASKWISELHMYFLLDQIESYCAFVVSGRTWIYLF